MFRRTSAVLVSALFLVSAFPSAQAGVAQLLPADFSQVLATLQSQHIIDSAATFRPDAILTRAEALSLVLRTTTAQPKLLAEPSLWKDVPSNAWYAKNVEEATQLGIVTPQDDGLFHPDRPVTRAELITMLYRLDNLLMNTEQYDLSAMTGYADVKPWDWYFAPAIWARNTFLAGAGIPEIDAMREGGVSFGPTLNFGGMLPINREEAAKTVYMYTNANSAKIPRIAPSNNDPFGALFQQYADNTTFVPETMQATTVFTGTPLTRLSTEGNVYKEFLVTSASPLVPVPESLRKLVPAMGREGFATYLNLISKDFPSLSLSSSDANSLTVGWMAQADEPQIRTGTSSGSVLKSADHILARLGIDASGMQSDVRMYDEYSAPDVSYYRNIDGLPVFTEWGMREAAIFINGLYQPATSNYSLTLQIAHPKMQGTYSLLSWDEVYARLQELYPEGSADICCFGENGSFYQYDDFGNELQVDIKNVKTVFTSAKEVMGSYQYSISQENGTTSHFYVPSVFFEGYVTGVNAAGETVDLGAAYELIPRVTLYPYDYGYDYGEGENLAPEEGMETVIE